MSSESINHNLDLPLLPKEGLKEEIGTLELPKSENPSEKTNDITLSDTKPLEKSTDTPRQVEDLPKNAQTAESTEANKESNKSNKSSGSQENNDISIQTSQHVIDHQTTTPSTSVTNEPLQKRLFDESSEPSRETVLDPKYEQSNANPEVSITSESKLTEPLSSHTAEVTASKVEKASENKLVDLPSLDKEISESLLRYEYPEESHTPPRKTIASDIMKVLGDIIAFPNLSNSSGRNEPEELFYDDEARSPLYHTDIAQIADSESNKVLSDSDKKFIEDEIQMLFINDDTVLGIITEDSRIDSMDFFEYAEYVQKERLKMIDAKLRKERRIDQFVELSRSLSIDTELSREEIKAEAFESVRRDNLNGIRAMLDLDPLIISSVDIDREGLLHKAVEANSYPIAYLLLMRGANINLRNNEYSTPIDLAIGDKNYKIVQLLMRATK
jgi:hypothetical protein